MSDVFNTEMTYDAMDRLTELTQPDDSVIAYGYNKAGLLETVKAKIRGITTSIDFVTNINYNEKGQRTEIYYKNGSKTAYTYDGQSTHTVVKGDTLWDIAQKSNGKYSVQDLLDWNPVIDPKQLQIGAEINLSDKNLLTYQWNEPSITSLGDLSPAYETYDSPESKNSYVGSSSGVVNDYNSDPGNFEKVVNATGVTADGIVAPISIAKVVLGESGKALQGFTRTGTVVGAIAGGGIAIYHMYNNGFNWGDAASIGLAGVAIALEFTGVGEAWDAIAVPATIVVNVGTISYDVYNIIQENNSTNNGY